MDNKTIVIAIAIAAAAYYFLVMKKKPAAEAPQKSQDEIDLESLQNNSATRTKLIGEATTATKMSGEDEDYNRKRIEYTELTGEEAPRSWTYDMLQDKINSFHKTQEALNEYVRISGDTDRTDEQGWTAARYESEIKNAEERKRQAEQAAREAETKRLADAKAAWAKRRNEMDQLLQNFILKLDSRGLSASKNALMKEIFPKIEQMNDAEFVYFMINAIAAYKKRNIDLINDVFGNIIGNPIIYFKENKASCEAIRQKMQNLTDVWKLPNQYGELA